MNNISISVSSELAEELKSTKGYSAYIRSLIHSDLKLKSDSLFSLIKEHSEVLDHCSVLFKISGVVPFTIRQLSNIDDPKLKLKIIESQLMLLNARIEILKYNKGNNDLIEICHHQMAKLHLMTKRVKETQT